ncbi:MAG: carboxypeptidase-like regulatory domain-containing protein, partial [Bacteroides sp.]|nr:carboxypeptidase-like regulatory domain-containing protein [Bacteroides sp.]
MRNILQYRNILCLLFALIGFANFAYAQGTITIKGVVRDAMDEPVIGATVVVVKSTIGTTTNVDGEFMLEVPEKSLIKVSY